MLSEKKLKCINCGKILVAIDKVFVVTTTTPEQVKYHSPTCSEECAKMAKEKNAEYFQKIVDEIRNSSVYSTNVNMYPCIEYPPTSNK